MVDLLISLLEQLGYPVIRQGTLADDEPYPSTFITFRVQDTADGVHYDNKPSCYWWTFDVSVYSNDPTLLENTAMNIKSLLQKNGFQQNGKGYDAVSDENSHTGWGMIFIKKEEN